MSIFSTIKQWVLPETEVFHLGPDTPPEQRQVAEALLDIHDPEVGIDIVNMGLIRAITVADGRCHLRMTLTTRGCPVGPIILTGVEDVIRDLGLEPTVELVFEPAWTPADISDAGRAQMAGG